VARGNTDVPSILFLALSSIATVAMVAPLSFVVHLEGGSWLYGLAAPIGLVISAWVAASAFLCVVTGRGIQWSGSVYR